MRPDLARALAAGFLAGEWDQHGLVDSGAVVVGRRRRWLGPLARQVLALEPRPPHDRPRELAALVAGCPAAERVRADRPVVHPVAVTRMVRNPWRLPTLDDLAQLSDLVGLDVAELDWFADPRRWARVTSSPALQHYRVSSRVSATGSVRVLEAPKHRLKVVQRSILDQVLARLPPHDAARGFRTGGSVASYAAPHAGRAVVIRLDLESFFASVTVGRVYGVWRTAGYPEPVAHRLAGLCTTVLPLSTWQRIERPGDPRLLDAHWRLGRRLAMPHLPQGAPTSPALANLAAYGLDVRLSALAASWGGRYTRYADDLAFSGGRGWGERTTRLLDVVEQIVAEEGFRLNARKSAVMPHAGRQVLGGLVVNDRPHLGRAEVDVLRAILHNCLRQGPTSQNREDHPAFREHLRGRIGWVAQHDPSRGAQLLATFDDIDWGR